MIQKLQGISLSQEEFEICQDSVTSQFTPSQPLTRAQRKKFRIPLFEFPLPSQKKVKETPYESHSEVLSSSSSILSIRSKDQSSISPLQIVIHTGTGAISSSTQSPSNPIASTSPTHIPTMAQNPPRPWTNSSAIRMAAHLH